MVHGAVVVVISPMLKLKLLFVTEFELLKFCYKNSIKIYNKFVVRSIVCGYGKFVYSELLLEQKVILKVIGVITVGNKVSGLACKRAQKGNNIV